MTTPPTRTEIAALDAAAGNGTPERGHVSVEANLRRRHHRVTVPLFLTIHGRSYQAADWSLGGFRIADYAGEEETGAALDCTLILPYSNFTVHLPAGFRIVRRRGAEIGCEFLDLGPVQHKALRHMMEAAVEGRLADVNDTLATLQEPAPAPQLAKLIEEEDDRHLYVAGRRLIRMSVFYAALGAAAVLVVCSLLYWNFTFVEVEDAVIMGNFIPMTAPVEGQLGQVFVREGQAVAEGEPLFDLRSDAIAMSADRARAELHTARQELAALEGRIEEEEARLAMLRSVASQQIAMNEAAVRRLDAEVAKAAADLARQRVLHEAGVVSADLLEAAQRDHAALVAHREETASRLQLVRLNDAGTREGRFFSGTQIEGTLRDLREQRRVLAARAAQAELKLADKMQQLGTTLVRAPRAGVVYTIQRAAAEPLQAGDVVMSLRTRDGYYAIARLKAEDAIRVRPGQAVTVHVASMGVRLRGVVSAIGHHSLSASAYTSPDLESTLREVPVKVALPQVAADVPPGIRARLRINLRRAWPEARTQAAAPPRPRPDA